MGLGPERSAADVEAGDRARGWGERRMVEPRGGQSGLLRRAEWLAVEAGCQGRRRCGAAWPGPGGAQDEGQEQHLDSDGEAVEVGPGPGLTYRLEHRDWDVERCYDEVRGAVHPGGKRHGEHHHQGRDRYDRDENGQQRRGDVELKDDAGAEVVDNAGLVELEVVDVDVEEHQAGPCGCEFGLHGHAQIFQRAGWQALSCGVGLRRSHHNAPWLDRVGGSTFTNAGGGHIGPGACFDLAVGTAELLYFRRIHRAPGLPRLIRWPPAHSARCGPNLDPRMPRTGGRGTGPWSQYWSAGPWWKWCSARPPGRRRTWHRARCCCSRCSRSSAPCCGDARTRSSRLLSPSAL